MLHLSWDNRANILRRLAYYLVSPLIGLRLCKRKRERGGGVDTLRIVTQKAYLYYKGSIVRPTVCCRFVSNTKQKTICVNGW